MIAFEKSVKISLPINIVFVELLDTNESLPIIMLLSELAFELYPTIVLLLTTFSFDTSEEEPIIVLEIPVVLL